MCKRSLSDGGGDGIFRQHTRERRRWCVKRPVAADVERGFVDVKRGIDDEGESVQVHRSR